MAADCCPAPALLLCASQVVGADKMAAEFTLVAPCALAARMAISPTGPQPMTPATMPSPGCLLASSAMSALMAQNQPVQHHRFRLQLWTVLKVSTQSKAADQEAVQCWCKRSVGC